LSLRRPGALPADLGAEVIKVEVPRASCTAHAPAYERLRDRHHISAFEMDNRALAALDLTRPEASAPARDRARGRGLMNLLPGGSAAFGLDAEALRRPRRTRH
jgi:crotonobetainyl-CoA:carnitine CoA-transferase CaiB-like acyl-CoA transferase